MIKDFFPAHSLVLTVNQTFFDKIFGMGSYFAIVWELQRSIENTIEVLIKTSAWPRGITINHLEKHEPQAPNI